MKKVDKPWGSEVWWAHAQGKYMGKILHVKKGHRLSLQYHTDKEETIYVLKGRLKLTYSVARDGELKQCFLEEGESYHVYPMTVHRFEAISEDVTLLEVSTDYPEDVVRIEDDYNRRKE
jgi:mannose-6-phosphate isomerase